MTAFWILVSAGFAVLTLTIAVVNLVDWEDLEVFEKVGYSAVLVLGIILGGLSGWLLSESTEDTNQQQITTMASKSMKPARPVAPAPLTEEQKKEQVLRYIAQQRNSIYQMALANIIQANPVEADGKYYADKVTALAKDIADRSIAILFSVDEKKEGEE
jgi:nitrous oxide reductase